MTKLFSFMPFWTAVGIQLGYASDWADPDPEFAGKKRK
jgi:hypothetical protein